MKRTDFGRRARLRQGRHTSLMRYKVEEIPTLEEAQDIAQQFEHVRSLTISPGPPYCVTVWCEDID